MGDHAIKQVEKFKYLRSIVQDCEVDDDVNNRIQADWFKWRKATGVICDRKVQDKVKGKFYQTTIRPTMNMVVNVGLLKDNMNIRCMWQR